METNLKKLIPIVGVVCLSMTQVFADYDDTSKDTSTTKMAVPPSPTPGESGPNVFISADYTLWTAREAGLAVATTNSYATASSSAIKGTVFYPDWKLRSGFKVDLGVYLPHDNWDMKAEYTWFYNKKNDMKDHSFTAGQAVPTWKLNSNDTSHGTLTTASSNWDVWFNRVDLTMGRNYFAGHYLSVRPFMGLLGAWDDQQFDIDSTTSSSQTTPNEHRFHQKFWGIGVYTGMNAAFTFVSDASNQWSLFADAGAALPWSKFDTDQRVYNSSAATTSWGGNVFYTVAPMIEATLGLRWETWWADGSWKFLLQAGWEEQVWFNHNNFIPMGESAVAVGSGAYTMQGLTVKAAVAF